jgi:glycosyltransferase involved in cell wall biosynthesis
MKLSIIIPAYNEENRMKKTLEEYYDFFKERFNNDFEIIIIPNNCNDNTLKVSEDFAKDKPQVRVFNIPDYSGKGGAVIKGFELAKGEFIGFTDADNSTNSENFFKLYQNKGDYEGVIASRKIKGAIIHPKRRLSQDISSFLFNRLVNFLFNFKIKDTQCGAKLFTNKTAKFLVKNHTETGWMFDIDLLYICKKNKLKLLEYPILWTDAEGSSLTFLDGINSALKSIKYRFKN